MKWIGTEECLPFDGDIVPVLLDRIMLYALFNRRHGFLFSGPSNVFQEAMIKGLPEIGSLINPTHWMPLPESPHEVD